MMAKPNEDLHGSAPDKNPTALLIIDMINDFDFENGEELQQKALPVAENIRKLKTKAKTNKIPVIYVNDNFGRWKSDFRALINHCINDNTLGRPVAETLKPEEDDYFVLKPKHSGFYSTTLDLLLQHLGTENLILTGVTTDICLLFTANDAYMRDYKISVMSDCCAAINTEHHQIALNSMERILKAKIIASYDLNLKI